MLAVVVYPRLQNVFGKSCWKKLEHDVWDSLRGKFPAATLSSAEAPAGYPYKKSNNRKK